MVNPPVIAAPIHRGQLARIRAVAGIEQSFQPITTAGDVPSEGADQAYIGYGIPSEGAEMAYIGYGIPSEDVDQSLLMLMVSSEGADQGYSLMYFSSEGAVQAGMPVLAPGRDAGR